MSLLLSGIVAWFSLVRRGKLRMTRPSLIVLMHDNLGSGEVIPKIFVRTLLYATGNRGHVVQSIYLNVRCGESSQNFSIWGHGPQNDLRFGAGLRVGADGVDHNHHFNPPKNATFQFTPGDYTIDIFAELAQSESRFQLGHIAFTVTPEQADKLKDPNAALYFEWGPDSQKYSSHVHLRPERLGEALVHLLGSQPQSDNTTNQTNSQNQ